MFYKQASFSYSYKPNRAKHIMWARGEFAKIIFTFANMFIVARLGDVYL